MSITTQETVETRSAVTLPTQAEVDTAYRQLDKPSPFGHTADLNRLIVNSRFIKEAKQHEVKYGPFTGEELIQGAFELGLQVAYNRYNGTVGSTVTTDITPDQVEAVAGQLYVPGAGRTRQQAEQTALALRDDAQFGDFVLEGIFEVAQGKVSPDNAFAASFATGLETGFELGYRAGKQVVNS